MCSPRWVGERTGHLRTRVGGGGEVLEVGGGEGGQREITQNSELCYTRITILGSCLFLQSVLDLHANRLHIKQQ